MNNKDTDGEDHPLKNNEGKALENNNDPSGENDVCIKKQSGLSRLSKIRTAVFFGALFLCLTVVFAFSFIIPCPVRPFSARTWSIHYNNSVGYPFLATDDVNKDNVQDVLFIFKTDDANKLNVSCMDEGFQKPCFFLSALSGTNGSTLWIRPVSDDDVQLVECNIQDLGGEDSGGCLVIRKSGFILAIDSKTGHTLWEKPTKFAAESTVLKPVLKIPDVDKDGVEDLMFFLFVEDELQSAIFSGKNGDRIGEKWRIGTEKPSGYYTHVTKSKAPYVLFFQGRSIAAYSVSDLCSHTADPEAKPLPIVQDSDWEAQGNTTAGFIPIIASSSSGNILYILNIPGRYYNNILVVRSEVSELLDGQKFQTLWTVNTTNILSKPALGFFKRDVFSIMMELETGMNKKKVIIVDSNSGALQWEYELNLGIARQNPAVLNTGDHRSTFLFWAVNSPDFNNSAIEENLFMFHPSHPDALLQLNNHTENIILFTAALFERSRHACYVLVTGPNTTEDPGTLTVSKRKLKEDLSNGKVIWFGTEETNTEGIRDDFFRMRYSTH
ncbi:protein FAM234A [Bufo bufo]|uniref:protein FAM234A n=1 Tax=Bufo bufo TaxID=8384 RepID=UPI001ABDE9FD|nr:protein FAM234A [Bufo bufo]XP_040297238.1 protein FAM234A [Bufo bufo]